MPCSDRLIQDIVVQRVIQTFIGKITTIYTSLLRSTKECSQKKNPTPPGALPNEFDPNNQCALCNTTYKKRKLYRRHLKTIHKMELTVCRPTPYPKITPNPNNARNHCGSCNWTYSLRNNYRFHLKEVHRMLTKAAKNNAQSKDYARYE